MVESLQSNDREARLRAADELAKVKPRLKALVPGLIRQLKEADAAVRIRAARALGYIGEDAREAIPTLLNQMKAENSQVAEVSAFALSQMGKPATKPVLQELESTRNATVQKHCIWVLGTLRARAAVPAIIKCLESHDVDVRDLAQNALGQIGDDRCVEALIKVFQRDPDDKVRRMAIYSLANIGHLAKAAIPTFIDEMLKEDSLWHDIVPALSHLGDSVVPRVVALLRDPMSKPFVRERCLYCIDEIIRLKGPAALEDAVPGLTPFLHDEQREIRGLAAFILGQMGEQAKEALPKLRDRLKDNAAIVRTKVAVAIIRIDPKDEEAFQTVAQEVSKGEKEVRLYAIEQMGNIPAGRERAVPILIKALTDPDSDIRRNAVIALGRLGSAARAAVPVLREMLNDKDGHVLEEVKKLIRTLEERKCAEPNCDRAFSQIKTVWIRGCWRPVSRIPENFGERWRDGFGRIATALRIAERSSARSYSHVIVSL